MKVREMLQKLENEVKIVFIDEQDAIICECGSLSQGIKPYLDYYVIRWGIGVYHCERTMGVLNLKIKENEVTL